MSKGTVLAGILLFAAATAILYIWGLKKSMSQGQDLERLLLNKCGAKVVKYLKKHGSMDQKGLQSLIAGVRVGQFWSRRRVAVQDPKKFAGRLTEYLLSQQLIESTDKGGFRLKK